VTTEAHALILVRHRKLRNRTDVGVFHA
jgi:hypothetical protein